MRRFRVYGLSSTLIVTIFAIAIILFIFFDNILVFVISLLVIMMLLLMIYAFMPKFYRQMSGTTELRDTALNARKSEIVGMICRDCKATSELLEKAEEKTDVASARSELERLGKELASVGCCSPSFEIESDELGHVDLTFLTTKSAEVRDRLGAIKRSVAGTYFETLRQLNEEREKAFEQLRLAGYRIDEQYVRFKSIGSRSSEGILEELVEDEQETEALMKNALSQCTGELEAIASSEKGRKGIEDIRKGILDLRDSDIDMGETKKLCAVKRKLQSILEQEFSVLKEALLESMAAVEEASRCSAFSDFNKGMGERIASVRDINDPGRIGELRETENEYRAFVESSMQAISKNLVALRKEMLSYKPPRDMAVKIPNRLDAPKGKLDEFTKKLTAMFSDLSPNAEALYLNVKILRSYPKVESLIQHRLNESNRLSAKEIDIRHPHLFFMLYSRRHPAVRFTNAGEPKLSRGGDNG